MNETTPLLQQNLPEPPDAILRFEDRLLKPFKAFWKVIKAAPYSTQVVLLFTLHVIEWLTVKHFADRPNAHYEPSTRIFLMFLTPFVTIGHWLVYPLGIGLCFCCDTYFKLDIDTSIQIAFSSQWLMHLLIWVLAGCLSGTSPEPPGGI